jgi:2,4-dienoyl-CoA reductase-like NADH-dependent reductase (Old Yellow Enzyme family)
VLTDDELDRLVDDYVDAAVLAAQAGFDFVDVKHCHGYLLHELLTGYDREGRYGGDLDGRTRFLRSVVAGIRERSPHLAVAVRLSAFDMVPFVPGAGGVGAPEASGPYRYAFGGTAAGSGSISQRRTPCSTCSPRSASVWSASPPEARTTTRTSSGRRTSRRRTGTTHQRIRSSVWHASSP